MYPRLHTDDLSLLQRYINENKLEEKGIPLSEMRRMEGSGRVVLGVDGIKIMDSITQTVRDREKLAILTSTIPLTVYEKITELCKLFQDLENLTPVLVFNGIPFPQDVGEEFARDSDRKPLSADIAALNGMDNSRLCNMTSTRAVELQKKIGNRFVIEEDVENQIIKLFRRAIKDTMRAPYLSWAQLSAFCHPGNCLLSEVYGCLELLAFPGITRVITNINPEKGTFDAVRKSSLLDLLRIEEDDFCSLVMLDSRNKTMRSVGLKFNTFDEMVKKIHRFGDNTLGVSFVSSLENEMRQQDPLRQDVTRHRNMPSGNAAVRNMSVLACPVCTLVDPYCVSLSSLYGTRAWPSQPEFNALFGLRLPAVIYYMLSSGLLSPSLISAVCQDCIVDGWPLLDSIKFRDAAEAILPLRVQTVHKLCSTVWPSHPREMSWFRRYNVSNARVSKINKPPCVEVDHWVLTKLDISPNVSLSDVMEVAEIAPNDGFTAYSTKEETRAAILLQTLDLLGYITHVTLVDCTIKKSELSDFGAGLRLCKVGSLSEYVVLLIELGRTKALTADSLCITTESNPPRAIPPDVCLASRILSLIPMNVSLPWTGPLDPELAAFSMISRMMSRGLRHLVEAVAAMIFYQKFTQVPLSELNSIEETLPFVTPVEFNGGLVVQYILMKSDCTFQDVQTVFPECTFLREDLTTLHYFWKLAMTIIGMFRPRNLMAIDFDCLNQANVRMQRAWENLQLDETCY